MERGRRLFKGAYFFGHLLDNRFLKGYIFQWLCIAEKAELKPGTMPAWPVQDILADYKSAIRRK
jgi:hypothetical protein